MVRKQSGSLSAASNKFTADVYKWLCSGTFGKTNVVISGFSLHSVLGMSALGARGATRKEMLKGLKLDEKDDNATLGKKFGDALTGLLKRKRGDMGNHTIEMAAKVYCSKKLQLNPVFASEISKNFKSGIEQLDFENQEDAAKKVNGWVSSTTHNMIRQVVSPDSFDKDTRLLLVNSIYFKGFWEDEFKAGATKDKDFFVSSKKKVTVKMMSRTDRMDYAELKDINAQAVRLPYRDGRFSMIIVLPRNVDNGLAALQNWNLYNKTGQSRVLPKLSNQGKVHLSLPLFKVDATLNDDIPAALEALGMRKMFSKEEADFGDIPDPKIEIPEEEKVFVTTVIQKALIEVDEEGTKAAAATVVRGLRTSSGASPTIIQFLVDHPFYFEIVDHYNEDRVLFSGHCVDPTITN